MTVESQSGMDFLFVLAVVACTLIVFLRRRISRKEEYVPATRNRLLWAAYGRYAVQMSALAAVLCLPVCIAYLGGRIGIGGLLCVCCIILLMLGCAAWNRILELRSCVQLLSRKDVDVAALLQGMVLVRRSGVLSYVDKNWYICLGGRHAILLYAPLINFDRAVEEVRFRTGSKMSLQDRLRFMGRDGYFDALCTQNAGLNEWIFQHGGAYDQRVLERRSLKREAQKKRALRELKKKKPAD